MHLRQRYSNLDAIQLVGMIMNSSRGINRGPWELAHTLDSVPGMLLSPLRLMTYIYPLLPYMDNALYNSPLIVK